MYELAIIGGGPAAVSAAVYAGRKQIKSVLIAEAFGGQSLVSNDIQNWIGELNISGVELAMRMENHVRAQETIAILSGEVATRITKSGELPQGHFTIALNSGKEIQAKTILIATGSRRRRLGIPGEDEFDGKGVVFCSTCDAPLFKNKSVAIIGGGNSALEAVVDSIPYASEIFVLVRKNELKGDAITQEKIRNHPKVKILFNTEPVKIIGDKTVGALEYKNNQTNETGTLNVQGVFVEIGSIPNSDLAKRLVEINARGEIVVDHKTQRTSQNGIWAAGDVSDVIYKQNNISSGDAVKALLNIYDFLHKNHLTGAHQ